MVTTRSKAEAIEPPKDEVALADSTVERSPENTMGLKRPRDYVEELRGLTPDRDSDHEEDHASKRVRTGSDQAQDLNPGNTTQSHDLDDGEVVEPLASDQSAAPAEPVANPVPKFVPESVPSQPTQVRTVVLASSEDELAQKPIKDGIVPVQLSIVPEVAGSAEAVPTLDSPQTTEHIPLAVEQVEPDAHPPKAEAQELAERARPKNDPNQGVGLGLRTSFAKAPKKPAKHDAPKPVLGVLEFPMMNQNWKIDASRFDQIPCDHDLDHGDCFNQKFWKQWMENNLAQVLRTLQEANELDFDTISKPSQRLKLVRNAMLTLIQPSGGILYGIKKDMNSVRSIAYSAFDDGLSNKMINKHLAKVKAASHTADKDLQEAVDETATNESKPQTKYDTADKEDAPEQAAPQATDLEPGEVESDEPPELSPEEIEHCRLYFPGSEKFRTFCVHCVSTKHTSNNCPQLACQSCGSREHTRYGCQTTQRCGKCLQLGHTTVVCQEKLALAKEEREPCAYCGSSHTEEKCTSIWRSFNHTEVEIKKVKAIPSFCYICGQEGHYGPECGLNSGRTEMESDLSIWSSAIRNIYVDPNSPDLAIAWTGLDATHPQPGQDFHIRGQAKKQSHVFYVSSDDSDDGFIHEPVKRAPPRGNIQINTNASRQPSKRGGFSSLRSQESQRRENQREFTPPPAPPLQDYYASTTWQPPLPAGPPPPPMPDTYTFQGQRDQSALPRAPHNSLPPRPGNQGGPRNYGNSSSNGAKRGRGRPRKRN